MKTTYWAYPWDLADEGPVAALELMRDRGGATGVNVAALYHAGKFLLPHNPRRTVHFPRSGTLYAPPRGDWHGRLAIAPPIWPQAAQAWPQIAQAARSLGVELTAWLLCLHNSGIGTAHPQCAIENAFGDRIPTDLCAHHPDVRAFLVAAAADVAAHGGVDRILLESLEWMPLRHGYHHEVIGIPTGPTVDLLMSLCFCSSCAAAARAAEVDLDGARAWVRGRLRDHFDDPFAAPPPLSPAELRAQAGGALGALLDLRRAALTTLLAEIAAAVRACSQVRIGITDFGPLYANGPDGRGWENGVDLAAQLPLVDEVHPAFYFEDGELHRRKVAEYAALVAGERPIVPALRAILPQTASEQRLREQLEPLRGIAAEASFYNYGFLPLPVLDWVRRATAG